MFEQIFKLPSAIARHREGPLAKERANYLAHLASRGASRSLLRQAEFYMLAAARRMKLDETSRLAPEQIVAAARSWANRRQRKSYTGSISGPKEKFESVVTAWFGFLGHLQSPEPAPERFAARAQDFEQCMRNERGLSEETIRQYRQIVRKFLSNSAVRFATLRALQVRDVENYLIRIGVRGCTRVYIRFHVSALRAFFRHAERRGWCAGGIAAATPAPRIYRHEGLPSGPSWPEVQRLLTAARTNHPTDIRDRAILMLFAVYGFRSGEVSRLRLDDIDWQHAFISITRSKQRCVHRYPLLQSVGEAILRYLSEVRPRVRDRALFITARFPLQPLSKYALWQIVSRRLQKLGVDPPQHRGPHCLRHACATHLLAERLSLKEIGDHLGHRSTEATRIYAKVDVAGLREVGNFDLEDLL
ncbi:MAG: site-specific integrase [Acidobacteria bacterium]|nr:site-specific integrase [Acidobacteriota bacterium]MCI0719951.1 site-specific integrase [Acidobacteriota bacterium]